MKKKRFNLYLTEGQIAELEKLSSLTALSVSEHVRRAIDEYLEKVGQENGNRK